MPHATLYIERSGEYLNYEEELNYEVEQLLDDITSDTVQPDTAGQHCPLSDKTPANDDGSEVMFTVFTSLVFTVSLAHGKTVLVATEVPSVSK